MNSYWKQQNFVKINFIKSMEEQVRQNSATYTLKIDHHDLKNMIMMMILIVMVMVIVVKVIIVKVMIMMLTVNTHVSYSKCVNSSKGCM